MQEFEIIFSQILERKLIWHNCNQWCREYHVLESEVAHSTGKWHGVQYKYI